MKLTIPLLKPRCRAPIKPVQRHQDKRRKAPKHRNQPEV